MTKLGRRLGDIYDDYRTACLSKKYYCHRLSFMKRINLYYEILIALLTCSAFASAILTIGKWYSAHLETFSALIPAIAALLAVLKPVLGWEKEIERLSKLTSGYAEIFEQYHLIVAEISSEQDMTPQQQWTVATLKQSMGKLSTLEDLRPRNAVLKRLQAEVHGEIPRVRFWYPDADETAPASCTTVAGNT